MRRKKSLLPGRTLMASYGGNLSIPSQSLRASKFEHENCDYLSWYKDKLKKILKSWKSIVKAKLEIYCLVLVTENPL